MASKQPALQADPKEVEPIPTAGELFPDGSAIELVRSGRRLDLLKWDGQHATLDCLAEHQGSRYRPAVIDPTIFRALRLPARTAPCGPTRQLFTALMEVLARYGLPGESAQLLAFFVFATWFRESLEVAPTLLICGPETEAALVLRLLACLCRRALILGELPLNMLGGVPFGLVSTLLINQPELSKSTCKILRASTMRSVYIPRGHQLLDLFCCRAVYIGRSPENSRFGDAALLLTVTPTGRLPLLDVKAEAQIAEDFQARLLQYRLQNYPEVSASDFQMPALSSPIAALARALGRCIVGDPQLRSGLETLLQPQDKRVRGHHATGPEAVVIQGLLVFCHENADAAHVGKVTELANAIRATRGEISELHPRAVGSILDGLGFSDRPRNGKGHRVPLLEETKRSVHELAQTYGVLGAAFPGCSHCVAVGASAVEV